MPTIGFKHFFTHVAGVTHENADGSSRQDAIACLSPFDALTTEREPENEHDSYAVKVCTESGEQIGYLPREFAYHAYRDEDDGWATNVFVVGMKRYDDGSGTGVEIVLFFSPPGATDDEGQEYLKGITPEIQRRAAALLADG